MNYEGRGKNWFEIYKYKNWFEIYFMRWKRKNCLRYVKMMSGVRYGNCNQNKGIFICINKTMRDRESCT
jgi:hypothetical protein